MQLLRRNMATGSDTAIKKSHLTAEDKARLKAALEARTGNTDVESDGDDTESGSDE
jgi:hypothetical protein